MTNCWWAWGVRGPINISPDLWSNSVKSASAGDIQQVCDRNSRVYGGFKTWSVGELVNESNEPPCNGPDRNVQKQTATYSMGIQWYIWHLCTFMFYGVKEVHTVKISLSLLYFNRIHLLTSFLCLLVILVEWTQLLHPPSPKDNPACLPDFVGGSTVSGGWLASTGYPWQLLPGQTWTFLVSWRGRQRST